jgi:hypothetical protein
VFEILDKTYYVPLQPPLGPPPDTVYIIYDATILPLWMHREFENTLAEITVAPTKAKGENCKGQ